MDVIFNNNLHPIESESEIVTDSSSRSSSILSLFLVQRGSSVPSSNYRSRYFLSSFQQLASSSHYDGQGGSKPPSMDKADAGRSGGKPPSVDKDKAKDSPGGGKPPSVVVVEDEAANLDKWLGFMQTMLGCVDNNRVEACSISLVPRQLRKSKEDAYTPQVVSIGPLHKGSNTDLLYMEEIKWRYLLRLLQRSKEDPDLMKQVLRDCGEAMLKLDEIVRASYNVEVKFNRNELAQIMVLDGCFLLELLISGSPQLREQINSSSDDDASLGAEVIEREKVLLDLTMLENQIPLIVLYTLSIKLFPRIFKKDGDSIELIHDNIKLIHEHALSILGYSSPDFSNIYSSEFKGFHFLQLVHSFIDKEKDIKASKDLKISVDSGEAASISHRKVKLQRCATRLEAAGVTIKPSEPKSEASNRVEMTRFDLNITFTDGKLEIPQLHITETTEAMWRNFIAWELNRTRLQKQRGKRTNKPEGGGARIGSQFISYAWFFRSLICSVHDVQLLQDRKVISVQELESDKGKKKIMSNEDLINLFRNITEGVPEAEIDMDFRFGQVMEKLNSYPTVEHSTAICTIIIDRVTESRKIMWHIFRCFITWIWYKWIEAYGVLRRVYIPTGWGLIAVLAAATGLALTAIQTYYSIQS